MPPYATELIDFITTRFHCFWLTTHCRAKANHSIKYLSQFYNISDIEKLKTLSSTDWETLKTEAIDLNSNFLWLEDYPFEAEKRVLHEHGKTNSLILVDLKKENELLTILNKIKTYL